MIWQLTKRDPAMVLAPWFVAGMVALALSPVSAVVAFPLVAMMAAFVRSDVRYLSALPIRKEDIYLGRIAAAMLLIWAPVLAAVGLVAVLERPGAGTLLLVGAMAMTPVLGYEALAMRGKVLPAQWTMGFATAATSALISFMVVGRGGIPVWPVALACVLSSAGLFAHTWYSIPRVGLPGPAAVSKAAKVGASEPFRARRFPWWLLSWFDLMWVSATYAMIMSYPSLIFLLWSGPVQPRERFRFLDSLPVSRRLWLAFRVTPILLALAGGYAIGIYANLFGARADNFNKVYISAGREWPPTRVTSSCAAPNVSPPLDFWLPASGGVAPVVTAPWGESYQTPVVRIYGYGVYNPYGVGCANSRRFLDWQYERASMAVYGRLMPKNDPNVTAPPRLRLRILDVGGFLAFGLLAMLPMMMNDWWRFQRLRKWLRSSLVSAVLGLAYAALMASLVNRFPASPVQLASWMLPQSLAIVVCVCIAAPCAVYWLMQRLLLASEIGTWGQASQSAWEIGRKL